MALLRTGYAGTARKSELCDCDVTLRSRSVSRPSRRVLFRSALIKLTHYLALQEGRKNANMHVDVGLIVEILA
jgi:hypothetical protein